MKHILLTLVLFLFGYCVPVWYLWAGPTESMEEDSVNSGIHSERPESWTILLYGNGDNNLSPSLVEDLLKIETVGSSPTFRIAVEVDFDASNEDENTESGLPQAFSYGVTRFLLEESDDPEHITSRPAERLPELNLDDPQVLFDFLNWGFKNYPADHYAVIFWDHGRQWRGFGGDIQDDTEEIPQGMTLEEMAGPLRQAMADHQIAQLDFIAYDTCLMAGIEVLDSFDGLCHYFLANPELDFGDGWNYGPALAWLKAHPNASMDQFVQDEVKAWTDLHMDNGKDNDLTQAAHSAIDMTKYPLVKRNFEAFCQALTAECSPDNLILPKMRRMASEYGVESDAAPGVSSEIIDLGNFAASFAQSKDVSPSLRQKAQDLADSIDAMITAKILGVDKFGASGLSIWYPIFHNNGENDYEDDIIDDYADEDIDEYNDGDDWTDDLSMEERIQENFEDYNRLSLFRDSSLWPDYLKMVSIARENFNTDTLMVFTDSIYNHLSPGETFSTSITIDESAGAFQLHGTLLRKSSKMTKRYIVLGEVITANLNGSGTYHLRWTPNLHYLCGINDESTPLALYPKNARGNYWVTCAEYQETPHDKPIEIQILILFEEGKGRILAVLQDSDDFSPIPILLAPGGKVTPDYWNEVRKGNFRDLWKGAYRPGKQSVTVPPEGIKGMSIETKPLPIGNYILEFEVENVNADLSEPFDVPLILKKDTAPQDN